MQARKDYEIKWAIWCAKVNNWIRTNRQFLGAQIQPNFVPPQGVPNQQNQGLWNNFYNTDVQGFIGYVNKTFPASAPFLGP